MAPSKPPPQPMLPHGFAGRIFGWIMETVSASNYRWVITRLKEFAPRTYLEIGFGTGALAELVAREIKPSVLCAVDPSELMFKKVKRRLKKFAKKTKIDLKLGNDTNLDWADGSFDAIVASHSFQFWSDPVTTLEKLRRLITPRGRVVFVLRNHGRAKSANSWLPNPISKSGNEIEGLKQAIADAGFRAVRDERLSTGSHGLVAECA
jgi:SAM-dependent methyltransferase